MERAWSIAHHRAERVKTRLAAVRRKPRVASHRRYGLEPLEPRLLLSTFTVTTVDDVIDPDDGVLSLREAIIMADENQNEREGVIDTVVLSADETYTLNLTGGNEDAARTGDLDITESVAIGGAGIGSTIIDASGLGDRVFHVFRSSTLTATNPFTINGGAAATSATALNDLDTTETAYSTSDQIQISGTRGEDGIAVNATFTFGTDGTTLGDLIDTINAAYNDASDPDNDQNGATASWMAVHLPSMTRCRRCSLGVSTPSSPLPSNSIAPWTCSAMRPSRSSWLPIPTANKIFCRNPPVSKTMCSSPTAATSI